MLIDFYFRFTSLINLFFSSRPPFSSFNSLVQSTFSPILLLHLGEIFYFKRFVRIISGTFIERNRHGSSQGVCTLFYETL